MNNLFQLGDFTLSSGKRSRFKIECDTWTDEDVECLAFLITKMVSPFSSVEGVPRGGLRLATALEKYLVPVGSGEAIHLIVDDVLTTGKSFVKAIMEHRTKDLGALIICGVVFSRGSCPAWVKALFQMPEEVWES